MLTKEEVEQLLKEEEAKCQQCLDDMHRYEGGNHHMKYHQADIHYRYFCVRIELLKQILK